MKHVEFLLNSENCCSSFKFHYGIRLLKTNSEPSSGFYSGRVSQIRFNSVKITMTAFILQNRLSIQTS